MYDFLRSASSLESLRRFSHRSAVPAVVVAEVVAVDPDSAVDLDFADPDFVAADPDSVVVAEA